MISILIVIVWTFLLTMYAIFPHFLTMTETKIDLYELLTEDELDSVTNIFLEALAREKRLTADVFEIETNIISDHFLSSDDYE